ncbi:hypothetical protein JYT79_00495 [Cardiobacterium sp. AH-315-I02]|nr:hypothetical protein [Cardiobacterium sp. AH-315-I02]
MKRQDIRLKAVLLTAVLVSAVALIVTFWPDINKQQASVVGVLPAYSETAVQFNNAVNALRERRYWQAIEGFRGVLDEVPTMPEAYVNIGFAQLELKQYELAKQAFNTSLELRANQINAYWGLAISHEGLCEIPAAIGAMKTFVHLAKHDSPYLRRANAALWEWDQLKQAAQIRDEKQIICP